MRRIRDALQALTRSRSSRSERHLTRIRSGTVTVCVRSSSLYWSQYMSLSLFAIFGAGLLTFASPCVLPLMPIYLATIAGTSSSPLARGSSSGSPRRRNVSRLKVLAVNRGGRIQSSHRSARAEIKHVVDAAYARSVALGARARRRRAAGPGLVAERRAMTLAGVPHHENTACGRDRHAKRARL